MFRVIAGIVLCSFGTGVAMGDLISDRATLEGIVGVGGIFEDFEGLDLSSSSQRRDTSGLLNSSTIFDGSGPGLVQAGANYLAEELYWNGDGYFDLESQTLGDSSGWRNWELTIAYTTSVTAMGIDLQGYTGFSQAGEISVYDTEDNLLGVTAVDGGFFGWAHAGGIGRVVVDAPLNGAYIMIDNHLYGVPTPSVLVGFGLYGLTVLRRQR